MYASRTIAAFFLFVVAGCGGSDDELSVSRAPIAHGAPDEHRGVVAVVTAATGTICSGVVIAPRVVLTARHCVAPIENGPTVDCDATRFGPTVPAQSILVGTSSSGATPNRSHSVRAVLVPEESGFCGHDIAALILARPVDATIVALRDEPAQRDETFAAIGFGRDGETKSGTRRRRDGLRVWCTGTGCNTPRVTNGEWWGDGAVCDGDSGGPALDAEGRLLGIASRKRDACSGSVYVDVASTTAFLTSAKDTAATMPEGDVATGCSVGRSEATLAPSLLALTLAAARFRRSRRRRLDCARTHDPSAPRRCDERATDRARAPASRPCERPDRTTRTP